MREHLTISRIVVSLAFLGLAFVLLFGPSRVLLFSFFERKTPTSPSKVSLGLGVTPRVAMAVDHIAVEPIPIENTLRVEKIGVDAKLWEGRSLETLKKGIWHRPRTGDPIAGGNMVLAGHRYKWTSGPNTFYRLPEVSVGDSIKIFWKQKLYEYVVTETYVVSATAVDIEKPTKTHELTLYTCTLLTAEERFVVKARLKS